MSAASDAIRRRRMTSGMSAKGSALGANSPESGVPLGAAQVMPAQATAGNGTRRGRGSRTSGVDPDAADGGTEAQEPATVGIALDADGAIRSASVRTLILGIDYDGRIVQHDRNAALILALPADELLGAQLIDLTAGAQGNSHTGRSADSVAAVSGLLEAIRSDREGSAMLTIETRDGPQAEAVVTVYPMRAGGTSLAALALLRIPVPRAERFVDPAVMRKQMLDDTFTRIGDTLDIDHLARELMDALPPHGPDGSLPLRRIALLHDRKHPAWEAAFPTGEILRYPTQTPYFQCM